MIHELKTWPDFFQAVIEGRKTFEVRKNDRGFQVGDQLLLREYRPPEYTGRTCTVQVVYLFRGGQFGVDPDYVVLGTILIEGETQHLVSGA